jgi:hypothetical protein
MSAHNVTLSVVAVCISNPDCSSFIPLAPFFLFPFSFLLCYDFFLHHDLNRTTNRLRRKFDATANYLETKVQMEQVLDSARRVNQVVGKGSNDGQAQRLWTALRASINDLARCYNLTPIGT